jgi:hypothetical protein
MRSPQYNEGIMKELKGPNMKKNNNNLKTMFRHK